VHPRIRLGLELPPLHAGAGEAVPDADVLSLAEVARLAEEVGLGTLWLVEGGGFDPVPLAGSLARVTTRLGVGIVIRPSLGRHPSLVARDITTLDLLSGGRAAVALVEDDGGPLDLERLGEAVSLLRLLLRTEGVTTSGRFYEVAGLTTRPRPAHAEGPPIAVGAVGLRPNADPFPAPVIAATSADVYITGGTPDDVAARRARLDERAATGEHPMLVWRGPLGPDRHAAEELAGSVLESGADGLIAVVEPAASAGGGIAAGAIGRVLDTIGPLVGGLGT
jgi:alkanesulfonate monooxygenase SsuD/methylene tetrahydromethanopterin reductase-like flavin-dependent oxidoreductase (luciferase family)